MPKHDIFVSYPHVHERLVNALVTLLRVGERLVFFDRTSIEPGTEWESAIRTALEEAKYIVVIWCDHSKESKWMTKETEMASRLQKPMIPVILDKTPLPEHIGKFQWVDFTEAFIHGPRVGEVPVAGAAVGALVFPRVGTVLGGVIGGLLGLAFGKDADLRKGNDLGRIRDLARNIAPARCRGLLRGCGPGIERWPTEV